MNSRTRVALAVVGLAMAVVLTMTCGRAEPPDERAAWERLIREIDTREQATRSELGENPTQQQLVERWETMRALYAARRLMATRHPEWKDATPYQLVSR